MAESLKICSHFSSVRHNPQQYRAPLHSETPDPVILSPRRPSPGRHDDRQILPLSRDTQRNPYYPSFPRTPSRRDVIIVSGETAGWPRRRSIMIINHQLSHCGNLSINGLLARLMLDNIHDLNTLDHTLKARIVITVVFKDDLSPLIWYE